MKKTTIFIFSFILILSSIKAQHVFDKGNVGINAAIGLGGSGGFFPSIEASGEYGAIPTGSIGVVSFGGRVAYKYSNYNYTSIYYYGLNNNNYNNHYHQFEFGVRAAWHLLYFNNDKWDVYGGLGSGIHLYTDYYYDSYLSNNIISKSKTGFYEEGFVGGRMMMSDGFGFYAEAGYSHTSAVRIGLTFLF